MSKPWHKITRGKSMVRKIINNDSTFVDEEGKKFDPVTLQAMALAHPRSGDRSARNIAKQMLRIVVNHQ